jgi:hypothetical protein
MGTVLVLWELNPLEMGKIDRKYAEKTRPRLGGVLK